MIHGKWHREEILWETDGTRRCWVNGVELPIWTPRAAEFSRKPNCRHMTRWPFRYSGWEIVKDWALRIRIAFRRRFVREQPMEPAPSGLRIYLPATVYAPDAMPTPYIDIDQIQVRVS